jgi:hypothetical protein
MKPPTEDQLNEEVDDGYGLHLEGEPSWLIQTEIDLKEAELDALELTAEMVADRWKKEEEYLQNVVRHYELAVELEMEWQDEVDPVAVAAEQDHLKEAKEKLAKEKEEYKEGKKKSDEAIDLKKRELVVLRDVLRRSHVGHF